MPNFTTRTNIPVPVGACQCPGTPHEAGDIIFLYPTAPFRLGEAAHQIIGRVLTDKLNPDEKTDTLNRELGVVYVRFGVADWSYVDADGGKVPLTPENIDALLADWELARTVANRGDALYSKEIMRPLAALATRISDSRKATSARSKRSPGSQTGDSTRRKKTSSPSPLTDSEPSTTTTTPPPPPPTSIIDGDSS